jgi:protein-tyrosine kinase
LATDQYDLVVIDTPPIGVISDAIPLVHQSDGVLVVSRLGVSRRDRATRLMKQLWGLNANILGVVINGSEEAGRGYYGYYYAEEQPERRRTRAGR